MPEGKKYLDFAEIDRVIGRAEKLLVKLEGGNADPAYIQAVKKQLHEAYQVFAGKFMELKFQKVKGNYGIYLTFTTHQERGRQGTSTGGQSYSSGGSAPVNGNGDDTIPF